MAGVLKTVYPFNRGPGHFCVGELDYERANETLTVAAAAPAMSAGQMLGKITATGKFVPHAPAAADGSENFAGILWADLPDAAADQLATLTVREATVNANALGGWAALTTPQKAAAIAAGKALGIIILV